MTTADSQTGNSRQRVDEPVELLRQEILRGVEDIKKGRFTTYQTDKELNELADKIIRRGIRKPVLLGCKEIFDLLTSEPTTDQLLAFKISASAQEQLEELLDKNGEEEATAEEMNQLQAYLHLSEYLTKIKARARTGKIIGNDKATN